MDDDFLATTEEALLDEAKDGQSEIIIEDYIPNDPWLEVMNSLVDDQQEEGSEEPENPEVDAAEL